MKSKDWDSNLTPEQNYVLKQEGTELPGSSPLNNEKRRKLSLCWLWNKTLGQGLSMKAVQAGRLFTISTRSI